MLMVGKSMVRPFFNPWATVPVMENARPSIAAADWSLPCANSERIAELLMRILLWWMLGVFSTGNGRTERHFLSRRVQYRQSPHHRWQKNSVRSVFI
jgi:hypothetical protein